MTTQQTRCQQFCFCRQDVPVICQRGESTRQIVRWASGCGLNAVRGLTGRRGESNDRGPSHGARWERRPGPQRQPSPSQPSSAADTETPSPQAGQPGNRISTQESSRIQTKEVSTAASNVTSRSRCYAGQRYREHVPVQLRRVAPPGRTIPKSTRLHRQSCISPESGLKRTWGGVDRSDFGGCGGLRNGPASPVRMLESRCAKAHAMALEKSSLSAASGAAEGKTTPCR